MKVLLSLVLVLSYITEVSADDGGMTDAEILRLWNSTGEEESAFLSLLPKGFFELTLKSKNYYSIEDLEHSFSALPGVIPLTKYSVRACWRGADVRNGVCLKLFLKETEQNKKILRVLKNPESNPVFRVNFWSTTEFDHNGGQFKSLNFSELPRQP